MERRQGGGGGTGRDREPPPERLQGVERMLRRGAPPWSVVRLSASAEVPLPHSGPRVGLPLVSLHLLPTPA